MKSSLRTAGVRIYKFLGYNEDGSCIGDPPNESKNVCEYCWIDIQRVEHGIEDEDQRWNIDISFQEIEMFEMEGPKGTACDECSETIYETIQE